MAPMTPQSPRSAGSQRVALLAGQGRVCWQRASRFLWYVIGYNWLASLAVLPVALLILWPLAEARVNYMPIASLAVMAYLFVELTAFCVESNWSRVGIVRFWSISAPFCALQAVLCLNVAMYDPMGCLLLSALCLGLREFLFEVLHADVSVGGYEVDERVISALMGGFTYCSVIAVLCGATSSLVRSSRNHSQTMSPLMLDILFALILPLARGLSRMLLCQSSSGAVLGQMSCGQPRSTDGADGEGHRGPPIDAILLCSDVAFALTMFLELTCAFMLLLIPPGPTFLVAVVVNAAFDVLFVYLLEGLQQRRARHLLSPAPAGYVGDVWSPSFCIDRPMSFVATLTSGSMGAQPPPKGEKEPLKTTVSSADHLPTPTPSVGAAGRKHEKDFWMRLTPFFSDCRSCGPRTGKDAATAAAHPAAEAHQMSPRVSVLLDEYDAGVIESRGGGAEAAGTGSVGQAVYLLQDRKMTFLTHLYGNTLAVVLAAACIPMLRLREFELSQLAWRIAVLALLRLLVDIVACYALEFSSGEAHRGGKTSIWQHRHEMATVHSWLFRAFAGICPLFAVISGTW